MIQSTEINQILCLQFLLGKFSDCQAGTTQCASGGMMALTRDPSFKRASTSGELSSIRLPNGETIRSIAVITASSLEKVMSDSVSFPASFDKNFIELVNHDLGDFVISQEIFEWSQVQLLR